MSPTLIIAVVLFMWFGFSVLAMCLCVLARRGDTRRSASQGARERPLWGRPSHAEPARSEHRSRIAF
jgi:hypothetical protein